MMIVKELDFSNKNIVVTGASSGIGREIAEYISTLGANVILIARNETALQKITSGMTNSQYYSFDLNKINEIESLANKVKNDVGKISGIVYSAGIAPMRPLNLLKPENLLDVLRVNFLAYIELVRCFTKKNICETPMSIVSISSVASFKGSKSKIAYAASKGAMDSANRCIAKELASKKIRVNSIQPSWVETDMVKGYKKNFNSDYLNKSMDEQELGIIKPTDIAYTAAYLLSNMSSKITGTTIKITAGRL